MTCTFYNCNDNPKKINKTLVNGVNADCNIINQTNISNILIITKTDYINKNYVYIHDLQRYYFVGDIEITNNMIIMHLHIDVLYTYKNIILEHSLYMSRVEDYKLTDMVDNMLQVTDKTIIDCKKISDDIITKNFTYVLGVR